MTEILKQQFEITNPFNEQMALKALSEQLSSTIFNELIQKEKNALVLTFTIEVKED
jgi:hypothetical protein